MYVVYCTAHSGRGGGGGCCSLNLLTAGYRSRVTGGTGEVSLSAAGEQDTQIARKSSG